MFEGYPRRGAGGRLCVRDSKIAHHRKTDVGRGYVQEVGDVANRMSTGAFLRHHHGQR